MTLLVEFIYLQVLDLLTTVCFMMYGIAEVNPVVKWVMRESPSAMTGLLLIKLFAVVLALCCIVRVRHKLLRAANVLFACVVAYNMIVLIISAPILQ